MSKKRLLIILGVALALMPFLGFPAFFRDTLIVVGGLMVSVIAFLFNRRGELDVVNNNITLDVSVSSSPQKKNGFDGITPNEQGITRD